MDVTAVLKFYDGTKGFGFAETPQGDLRLAHDMLTEQQLPHLVGGALLQLEVLRGKDGLVVRRVVEITFPWKQGIVKWFSEAKDFGFIVPVDGGPDIRLSGVVAAAAHVLPWDGLPVNYVAVAGKDGRFAATKVFFPTLEAVIATKAALTNVAMPEATVAPAPDVPTGPRKVVRRRRELEGAKTVVDSAHPVAVKALPNTKLAAGLAALGLVTVEVPNTVALDCQGPGEQSVH
jgi:cold shock CspA family protein